MVRLGDFEVTVLREDGTPFFEVLHQGQLYVVAEPGALFHVRCRRLDKIMGRLLRFFLKVDGRDVGYNKVLLKPESASEFTGFLNSADKMGVTYNKFKFASPTVDHGTEATSLEFNQGKIKVEIWEVVDSGQNAPIIQPNGLNVGAQAVPALPEGKKFFLAPSLNTVSGGRSSGGAFTTKVYNKVQTTPEAEVTLRYETPTALLLRKILTRDNPAHAAILDSYPETRQQQQQQRQQQQQSRGPAESMQSNHPGVKRERSEAGGSGSRAAQMIDLSGVNPRPQEAEFLACDLTADEDAPRWEKRRARRDE